MKSAAVVRNSQNLHQMQTSKTTLVALLGKRFRALVYKYSKKQQWRTIPATSFKEFLVEIYRESHSYVKLIMMSIPVIHISYNLEHFIRSSCEGSKKISDSFR